MQEMLDLADSAVRHGLADALEHAGYNSIADGARMLPRITSATLTEEATMFVDDLWADEIGWDAQEAIDACMKARDLLAHVRIHSA